MVHGKALRRRFKKLDEVRPRANKHCLVCQGAQCALKRWPEDQGTGRSLCQSLYCVPKLPRAVASEQAVGLRIWLKFVSKLPKTGAVH